MVESEAHDISQSIIGHAFRPSQPTVCEYIKDQTLTVNVLWEVAYRVCHEVLCLNSLEDFNTTEADLMDLKNDILAMWDSRDRHRTSSFRPTFTSSSMSANEKGYTLGKTFTPARASASTGALHGSGYSLGETSSPLFRPLAPPLEIPHPLVLSSYIQDILPTSSYPAMGTPMGYNFNPMMGRPLKSLVPSTHPLLSQPLGVSFSTPISPDVPGLSALSGLSGDECPLVVTSPSHSS